MTGKDIRIEQFPHHDGPIEDYLSLPQRIENLTDNQAEAERAGTKALLDPSNTYSRNGDLMNFLAYSDGQAAGRLTAFHNRLLASEHGHYGLVGLFTCINDPDVARELITKAASWLAQQGMEMMRGPMAGDIWHRWRFMTKGFETPPFPGEPRNPEYYPELFAAAGFARVRTYSTKLITDLPTQLARLTKPMAFSKKRGITYRNMDRDNWRSELDVMFELCRHSFATNWSMTDTTAEEFRDIYDRWLKRAGPNHIIFALDASQAVIGLGLAVVSPADTINVKTVAVLPSQYGFGLGQAIAAEIYERGLAAGQVKAQHCLMDPLSPAQRWDHGLGQVTREYAMYERAI